MARLRYRWLAADAVNGSSKWGAFVSARLGDGPPIRKRPVHAQIYALGFLEVGKHALVLQSDKPLDHRQRIGSMR